ncbi:hypothetical protein B0H21DRAFT_743576 [Amylocystis lapponica]|nr:hypothetical protein B0H21DRAFT_743576 [Amylocystis lapponica]
MSDASMASVEINDALFCSHFKEVVSGWLMLRYGRITLTWHAPQCAQCSFDGREENDTFFGFDPIERAGLEAPASSVNKEGQYQCKKHGSAACTQCYGWKKQITRARTAAKKAGKK